MRGVGEGGAFGEASGLGLWGFEGEEGFWGGPGGVPGAGGAGHIWELEKDVVVRGRS